jgi:hypothetical protein
MKILLVLALLSAVCGFTGRGMRRQRVGVEPMRMGELSEEVHFKNVAISGFLKASTGFAESFIFDAVHATGKYDDITAVTDDVAFARKRLVSPKHVYSGLIDVLEFAEADGSDEAAMTPIIAGKEAWLAFNVTTDELPVYASVAAKNKCKRVVFAVYSSPNERGEGVTLDAATKTLADAGVDYTLLKFGDVRRMDEAKYPYRLVRADARIPEEDGMLSSGDLMRVLAEIIDLPKTFNQVYGIGKGNNIDSEIQVYMKSQGWPERVQVGLLVGDLMETIQTKYEEQIKAREAAASVSGGGDKKKKRTEADMLSESAKFAGFM